MLPVCVVFQVLQSYLNFSSFDTFFRRGNIFFYYVLLDVKYNPIHEISFEDYYHFQML